eukprot:2571996-Alexandrium_andersonii.AAC.1
MLRPRRTVLHTRAASPPAPQAGRRRREKPRRKRASDSHTQLPCGRDASRLSERSLRAALWRTRARA